MLLSMLTVSAFLLVHVRVADSPSLIAAGFALREILGAAPFPIIMKRESMLLALAEGSRKQHNIAARDSRIVFFTGILSYDSEK